MCVIKVFITSARGAEFSLALFIVEEKVFKKRKLFTIRLISLYKNLVLIGNIDLREKMKIA